MSKFNKSRICKNAYEFINTYSMTQAEAMRLAWLNEKNLHAMKQGVASFEFRKKDGTVRTAHGTVRSELVPPTGDTRTARSPKVQTFYDTDKNEWRCYLKTNLLKVG